MNDRLIKAEALKERLANWGVYDDIEVSTVLYFIDEEATIDTVKRGVWKKYKAPTDKRPTGWICTNCSGVHYDLSNGDTDYCPHCGAVMDRED